MANRFAVWVSVAVFGILAGPMAAAQSSDEVRALGKEVEALKAGQAALQKDMQEIKALLQGAQAAPAPAPARSAGAEQVDVKVSVAGAPTKGQSTAKITLVEFTDYQCPFCSRHYRQVWPQIDQDYVKTGKVKLVLRDMALEQIHPQALKAAEAARCAGEQGKYWEMHDVLFGNQNALARKDLSSYAQALGMNVTSFDQCVDSSKETPKVRSDTVDSTRAGARGTPTFYLGLTDPGGTEIKAVKMIRGAQSYASFKEAIDGLLAAAQ